MSASVAPASEIPKDPGCRSSPEGIFVNLLGIPGALRRLVKACCAPSGEIPKDPGFKSSPDGILVAFTLSIIFVLFTFSDLDSSFDFPPPPSGVSLSGHSSEDHILKMLLLT